MSLAPSASSTETASQEQQQTETESQKKQKKPKEKETVADRFTEYIGNSTNSIHSLLILSFSHSHLILFVSEMFSSLLRESQSARFFSSIFE
jgi:hypothetical protein